MTRAEIIPLLKQLLAVYPNNGVTDVKSLVDAWEMLFGEEKAEDVYKACRLHMNTSQWFPKASEIKKRLYIASNLYENVPQTRLEAKTVSDVDWTTGCDICPYNDGFCIHDNCIV